MSQRAFGERIPRNEDPRLLTGRAQFVDDVHRPGMAHVAFRRSHRAHARLTGVDASAARAMDGVHGVYTAEDLGDYWRPGPLLVPPIPAEEVEFHERTQVPLARDRIRHAGEPIAAVVAESRYVAEDAAAAVEVEAEPLPAVASIEDALAGDAPLVHEDLDSNLAARVTQRKGDWAAARAEADHVVSGTFRYDRGAAAAIENRGIVAEWDDAAEELTVWDTTQAPVAIRNGLAGMLGLTESQVRVVAPFIGGGFGPKIMMFYPEEVLLPWLARETGRPVKWIEDRWENFFATTQERGQVHEAEMALAADGTILGVKDDFVHDTGAYDPYGLTVPVNSQCELLGPYRVPNYESTFRVVFTNTPIVSPVRGAGRQHGTYVMERLLDRAARELETDRIELRRHNLLRPDEFPVHHDILYQDAAEFVYDSGDYGPALDEALEAIGRQGFEAERERALGEEGVLLGLGVVPYTEGTGIGPYEGARVTVEATGTVSVRTGVGTQGQGHHTSLAQVVAEQLGVAVADVRVVTGDTREFHWGTGTFASRGAVVAGNATHAAAKEVREKAIEHAAEQLECAPEDVVLEEGEARVAGAPARSVPLGALAEAANPLRGAVEPGTKPGLEAEAFFGPEKGTTASGVHAAVVAVDPDTAQVEVRRYVVIHDCGRLINPMIVEGQVHGGVAMGIGDAHYEELVFDEDAQLTNATLMDYLLPTAAEVPAIEVGHRETPAPDNELGTKGVGEAGAIPVGAVFAQAVEDALRDFDVEIAESPLTPERIFRLLENGAREGGDRDGPGPVGERADAGAGEVAP